MPRQPVPTNLKILRGNPGKRAINKNEPQPSADGVKCPSWLSRDAKAEWRRVAPELKRLGLLTVVDVSALAMYCESYSQWREAVRIIEREGQTYSHDGLIRTHPACHVANNAARTANLFAGQFGMTPSARTKLSIEPPQQPSLVDKFLNRSG